MKCFDKQFTPGDPARRRLGRLGEKSAGLFDHRGPDAVCEDAGMAKNSEVELGNVLNKSSYEILDAESERGDFASGAIFVLKGYSLAVESGDVVFSDDGTLAVAADVSDSKCGVLERFAKVKKPFFMVERRKP